MKTGTFRPSPRSTTTFGSAGPLGSSFPTPKATRDYDAKWAYALSLISGWAYAEGQVLADQLQYYGFPQCTVEQLSVANPAMLVVATAYFVRSQDGRTAILAFRGTEPTSLINWLTDAECAKYAFGGGYVHSGFFANVEALWGDISETVQTAIGDGRLEELYITGHSLGGAMAVVAAARIFDDARLTEWQRRTRGIYTFGQPIVGDGEFKAHCDPVFGSFLFRHVYDDDVVPCLPPTSVDSDFKHFGVRRHATDCDETWEVQAGDRRANLLGFASVLESFITRRIDIFHGVKVAYSLDDHSPRGYIDVCRNSVDPNNQQRAKPLGQVHQGGIGRLVSTAAQMFPFISPSATLRLRRTGNTVTARD